MLCEHQQKTKVARLLVCFPQSRSAAPNAATSRRPSRRRAVPQHLTGADVLHSTFDFCVFVCVLSPMCVQQWLSCFDFL